VCWRIWSDPQNCPIYLDYRIIHTPHFGVLILCVFCCEINMARLFVCVCVCVCVVYVSVCGLTLCTSALGTHENPLPSRYDGFSQGMPGAPIRLEAFMDLVCPGTHTYNTHHTHHTTSHTQAHTLSAGSIASLTRVNFMVFHTNTSDSKAAWPTMIEVMDYYGPSKLNLITHIFPLPIHRNAFLAAWGMYRCVWECVCMYVCMYVCRYVCVCVCVCRMDLIVGIVDRRCLLYYLIIRHYHCETVPGHTHSHEHKLCEGVCVRVYTMTVRLSVCVCMFYACVCVCTCNCVCLCSWEKVLVFLFGNWYVQRRERNICS